jgi:hypothetical protein
VSHFARIPDPGIYRRKLSPEQARHVVALKDDRRLSWCSIAAWYTRNGVPISYQAVRETYRRTRDAA